MTELVGDVRMMMDAIGQKKGKKLLLMVTLPRTIAECDQVGLDVRRWVKDGLVDIVVSKNLIHFEQEIPVKEWVGLTKDTPVEFYAGFEHGDTVETFRAGAAKYFRDGAGGIYFYNFWSFGLPFNALGRQILTEVGDPNLLVGQDKHYALLGGGPCPYRGGDPRPPLTQVPVTLAPGGSKIFSIDIADDIPAARRDGLLNNVTLRVATTAKPEMGVFSLNGERIPSTSWSRDGGYCQVVLDGSGVKSGINVLAVINKNTTEVLISSIEALVSYRGSRPPAGLPAVLGGKATNPDTRYPVEEGPWKNLESRTYFQPYPDHANICFLAHRDHRFVPELEPHKATVKILSADALASAQMVRFEFRTPTTNETGSQWQQFYGQQPWATDKFVFSVNGHGVDKWELIQPNHDDHDYWIWGIAFDVPATWLNAGDNRFEIRLAEREEQIAWGLVFVRLDLFMK